MAYVYIRIDLGRAYIVSSKKKPFLVSSHQRNYLKNKQLREMNQGSWKQRRKKTQNGEKRKKNLFTWRDQYGSFLFFSWTKSGFGCSIISIVEQKKIVEFLLLAESRLVFSDIDIYLHRQHFNVVKSLSNNASFVISKPDKCSGVVILNRHDYVN